MPMEPVPASRLKQIRALSRRGERDRTGQALVEGIRPVAEALAVGVVECLIVAPTLLTSDFGRAAVAAARAAGTETLEVAADRFRTLAAREHPQGLLAVVRQHWSPLADIVGTHPYSVALQAVQDPGNVGTILRTAAAVGGAGLILVDASSDPYHPTAIRASMGALFRQRLARASFAELASLAAETGTPIVGAAVDAPVSYRAAEYRLPLVLLMGSEREGLTAAQSARCDLRVAIPMASPGVDSLNLAMATGILLYELFHRLPTTPTV